MSWRISVHLILTSTLTLTLSLLGRGKGEGQKGFGREDRNVTELNAFVLSADDYGMKGEIFMPITERERLILQKMRG